MAEPSSREAEYVVVRDGKPKKTSRYYYDDDDLIDYDTDTPVATTRRIIRRKPVKEQRIKYVSADEPEGAETPANPPETTERSIKVRRTTHGDKVLLDEDDNIIKVIRSARTPTPPQVVEPRRVRVRRHHPENRVQYYETPDGQIIARSPRKASLARHKEEIVYSDDEPTKVIRKLVIDPTVKETNSIYEKELMKKPHKKYVIRQRPAELPIDSDDEYEIPQHRPSQYVQVVQRRAAPAGSVVLKKEPSTKYVMIRKKAESEPVYAVTSSMPMAKGARRIVYEAPGKDATTKYVYSTNGKFYK